MRTVTLVEFKLLMASALVGLALLWGQINRAHAEAANATNGESVSDLLEKMSVEQKVGQLFVFGFSGNELNQKLEEFFRKYQPGALIAFGHNVRDFYLTANFNRAVQALSIEQTGVPLFIMVDQEGGSVTRVRTKPRSPSALAIAETGSVSLAQQVGEITGDVLRVLGFNMNLAPVLDLSDPLQKSFIGNRAFSGDPDRTSAFALAYSQGLAKQLVIPTGKHFPGHGGLIQDSHRGLPKNSVTLAELEKTDLVPFANFLKSSYPTAVMVAHVAYPRIDSSGNPAAFSTVLVTEVLRKKMAYQGIVLTDDLEMAGADSGGNMADRAIKAIQAGCDMIMVAWSPKRQIMAYKGVLQAVRTGKISEERIDESVRRILTAKLKIRESTATDPLPPDIFRSDFGRHLKALKQVSRTINRLNFDKSATALQPESLSVPSASNLVVFTSEPEFHKNFQEAYGSPVGQVLLTPKTIRGFAQVLKDSPQTVAVFYATGTVTARAASVLPASLRAQMIVVNATYPGAFDPKLNFRSLIHMHSPDSMAGDWLGQIMRQKRSESPDDLRQPAQDNE